MRINLSLFEIFLLETAVWLGLWLINDYIATLLTLIIGLIVFVVLIIAAMAEWIEPSKVPARYFYVMIISVVAPIVAAVISLYFLGGKLSFLEGG